MNHNSKQYKDLQRKWDSILKKDGFDDIEQRDGALKTWSAKFVGGYHSELTMEAKREYYRAVGHFLYDHTFKNRVEKRIWLLHGGGMSIRNIVKALTAENLWPKGRSNGVPNKRAVHETIQRLVKQMMTKVRKDSSSDR